MDLTIVWYIVLTGVCLFACGTVMYMVTSAFDYYLKKKENAQKYDFYWNSIPHVSDSVKQMSMEMINEINEKLWNQFKDEEP